MKRGLVVMIAVTGLFVSAAPGAEAATPVSVVGSGKTVALSCGSSRFDCTQSKRGVTITTAGNTGVLAVNRVTQGPVNCVRSAVVNGRKGVVVGAVSTSSPSSHELFLMINEGGRGREPWAAVVHWPKSVSGGQCGGHLTASEVASGNAHPVYSVPPHRYVVVGG